MGYDQSLLDKVREIAEECQGGHPAFCTARCPMHTDVPAYVNLIAEGDFTEAVKKIREKLFLPGTLGRICTYPCETECRRNTEFNQPISIAALKRFAATQADAETLWDTSVKPTSGKKVAVIGAGPAGAQAAIELAREGHSVTIYEKLDVVGGMMRVGIPEYRLPGNIIDFEYKYLELLGVTFKMGVEVGKDIQFDELTKEYDAVIVANGAFKGLVPAVKGSDGIVGITSAVDFLKEVSFNRKAELVCKNVVVIGGGDSAMDAARCAKRLGAEKVYIAYRRSMEEMPVSNPIELLHAQEEGIDFRFNWLPDEVLSTDGQVSGITFKQSTTAFDTDGNYKPVIGSETLTIECDTLIFAAGQHVTDVTDGTVKQGRNGSYVADEQTLATSNPKVFIAGDCAGATMVVEAMALGKKAAISANRYLSGKDLSADRDFQAEYNYKSELDIPLDEDVEDLPRKHTQMLDPKERIKSFVECDLGFDVETAIAESSRCLGCECKTCMIECIMFNDFALYPGELFKKFLENGDIEPLIAYSCNMCDQCTLVCPKEFKFAELFGDIRKAMVKNNNGQSPMPGHKGINLHQKLGFGKLFTVRMKGGKR